MTNTAEAIEFERTPMVIEKPSVNDAEQIAKLAYESWVETYPNDEYGITKEYIEELRAPRVSPEGIESLKERLGRLDSDPSFFMVVSRNENGQVVGFIDGEKHADSTELQDLFVAKEAHGTGLATQLWAAFKAWADADKPIWLSVVPYTDRAPAFYKKMGFVEIKGSEGFYKDTPLPTVKMERPVGI